MIEEFVLSDLDKFEPNRLSDYQDVLGVLNSQDVLKYSLKRDDEVLAIVAFFPYHENNWNFFVLFSWKFKAAHIRELKEFWECAIETIKPDRIVTDSVDKDFNNKLHRMFGFELEGTRRKHMFGIDINMWGRVWE